MYVLIDGRFTAALQEAFDLKSFKLVVWHPRSEQGRVAQSLAAIDGKLDDSHAWISAAWLRRQPEVAADAGWQTAFTGLLGYAAANGWVDNAGELIRAHVVWRPGPEST